MGNTCTGKRAYQIFITVVLSAALLAFTSSCGNEDKSATAGTSTVYNTDTLATLYSPMPQTQTSAQSPESTPASNPVSISTPALTQDIEKADILYEEGFQYYLAGDRDMALKKYEEAIAAYSSCYKAYNGKGIILCFRGNYTEGMGYISKAIGMEPAYAYSSFNMALAYKLKHDYSSALEWFDKTIAIDPANTWSYFGKACIYAEWGDAGKAVPELAKAIGTDPTVRETARHEPDLDPIRGDQRFIDLIGR